LMRLIWRGGGHFSSTTIKRVLSPLATLPLMGSRVICDFRSRLAFLLAHLRFLGDGKCRIILGGILLLRPSGCVPVLGRRFGWSARELFCQKVIGDGVSGKRDQSYPKFFLHLEAMGRSQSGVELILPFSFIRCFASLEDRRARR
jgi:hypothetical protein